MKSSEHYDDLEPRPYHASYIDGSGHSWVVCGSCGCNRRVEWYIFVQEPIVFQTVCDCPLPTVFTA